jgi:hypothetical protein
MLDETTAMDSLEAMEGIGATLPMDLPIPVDAMQVDLHGVDIFGDPLHAPSKLLRARIDDLRRRGCCT